MSNAIPGAGARRPRSWERGGTIVSEQPKSNHVPRREMPAAGPMPCPAPPPAATPRQGGRPVWGSVCEHGLGACLFLLPLLLALVPRGAAPLVAVAGLCAAGVVAADPQRDHGGLSVPAVLLGLLVTWGGMSALWALEPARSLLKDLQLLSLFAAAIVLAAAARSIVNTRLLTVLTIAGTLLGLVAAGIDFGTGGGISQHLSTRPFAPPRLNQISVWLAIMMLPLAALLWESGRRLTGIAAACLIGATVFLLDSAAAKTAFALGLPVAALLYWRRRLVARIAAALSLVAVLAAPLTLPLLADDPQVLHEADTVKTSLGHRLLIWDFAGKRIAERPLLGWGLDSARAIPGGEELIRLDQRRLPLHPHNTPLQVWLELGAPGAMLFALLLLWVWLCLGTAAWPRLYAAAAGGSLAAVSAVLSASWGVWQEWWLATLGLAVFAIITMARAAAEPAVGETAIPRQPPGSRACGR